MRRLMQLLGKLRGPRVDPLPPLPSVQYTQALGEVYEQLGRTKVWRERLVEVIERIENDEQ